MTRNDYETLSILLSLRIMQLKEQNIAEYKDFSSELIRVYEILLNKINKQISLYEDEIEII